MTVAVLVKGYPRLSETFIAQEIHGLEARGVPISIVSLRHPTDALRHAIHDSIAAPVTYLPEYLHQDPRRVASALRQVRSRPGYRAARAAFLADLRRDPTRNRVRRFGQACVLAAELAGGVTHLHAHFLHTPGSVARYAARMTGLPFSLSGHAKDVWTTPGWDLAAKLHEAAWTVTCNGAAAARLRQVAPGAAVDLVYHGINLHRFPPPGPNRQERRGVSASDAVRLVSVGRAVEKKGYDILLAALAGLPSTLHWHLTHIGAGPCLKALKRQARALGIGDRIAWRGAQTQREVLGALRAADLFAIAPRITRDGDRDGVPNVLLEAQSQGLAVVATTVSGIPELVLDGETGLLAPPEDPAALRARLHRLIAAPDARRTLGDTAAARVRARFDSAPGLDALAQRFRPTAENAKAA